MTMEEELNEDELEERLYAMIHYADDTQQPEQHHDFTNSAVSNQCTLRRYWRTSADLAASNTPYQKVNPTKPTLASNNDLRTTPNDKETTKTNTSTPVSIADDKKPSTEANEVKEEPVTTPGDLSILQDPVPEDIKITVHILGIDENIKVVELVSSDEDEVVEIALPPKPTITIESSDDDDAVEIIPKKQANVKKAKTSKETERDREISASPVPSIVSSVSDDFIRGDCIALNISSRHPTKHSFDFSLHGADLVDQSTPSKSKKKKRKNKENNPAAAVTVTPEKPASGAAGDYFATPKSKSKKKQKNKNYKVAEKSIPNPDVYDSDSNNSIDVTKKKTYTVTDKSCPSTDIYESDSSQSATKDSNDTASKDINDISVETNITANDNKTTQPNTPRSNNVNVSQELIDLTDISMAASPEPITENIVMGNVIGFEDYDDYYDGPNSEVDSSKLGSTNVPSILFENLDFDFLKGKSGSTRRFSLEGLRSEMERFYNESWGGENFNHREIQKSMSRDKSLWEIDPKDKLPQSTRRKITCNYCNRIGHKDDTCWLKPPVCHMCGTAGHFETRCPNKICVNCGSPSSDYRSVCGVCAGWAGNQCAECGQGGHPRSHCPDLWRRYHNTIDNNGRLEELRMFKRYNQLYCSGCARRGHLVHTCRLALPFSGGLPINSPFVYNYQPIYPPKPQNKRQIKSPAHDNLPIKKRLDEPAKERRNSNRSEHNTLEALKTPTKAKDFIKVPNEPSVYDDRSQIATPTSNTDKNGHAIQDSQVSDTSTVTTTSRIYITKDVSDTFKTSAGEQWLREKSASHNVVIELPGANSQHLVIKGTTTDQEAFQRDLREWVLGPTKSPKPNSGSVGETNQTEDNHIDNIPKKRNNALRHLSKAFEMLEEYHGDPKALFKELNYHQTNRAKLLKQKIISPKQLSNNRDHIRGMMKRLNMVLLGQAGLADGPRHLRELHSMQEKLIAFRNKTVPIEMRKEIGQHYNSIFAAIPRDDYEELINKYYDRRQPQSFMKIKKKANKTEVKKVVNPFSAAMKNAFTEIIHNHKALKSKHSSELLANTLKCAGASYRMLMKYQPASGREKKVRVKIARILHDQMSALGNQQGDVTSKQLKKVRQVTERAHAFVATTAHN